MKKTIRTPIHDIAHVLREVMHKKYALNGDDYDSFKIISLTDSEGIYHCRLHPSFLLWIRYLIPSHVTNQILHIQNRSRLDIQTKTIHVFLETIDSPYFRTELSIEIPDNDSVIVTIHACNVSYHNITIPTIILDGIQKRILDQVEAEIQHVLQLCDRATSTDI